MDQHIAVFVAMVLVVLIIASVIISWFNYRLKKRIIDSGPIDEEAKSFLKTLANSDSDSLKWGCVVFSAGLGLVLLEYIPYNGSSPFPYGLEAMFIAAGFLIYYIIIRKQQTR